MATERRVGGFAMVSFPEFGIGDTIAKIDTGAYSGALHATGMQEVATPNGAKVLEFHPLGDPERTAIATEYRTKQIKSSNGQLETRYVVKTKLNIDGTDYPITISLSDRSAMMKHVLIGRQFLRRHKFVVDVRQGTQYRYAKKDEQ